MKELFNYSVYRIAYAYKKMRMHHIGTLTTLVIEILMIMIQKLHIKVLTNINMIMVYQLISF